MGTIVKIIIFVVVILLVLSVIRRRSLNTKEPRTPKGPIARVEVHGDGSVTLDGADISLDELRVRLKKLKDEDGAVWYSRDSSDKETEQAGETVVRVITEAKIPVRLMDGRDH